MSISNINKFEIATKENEGVTITNIDTNIDEFNVEVSSYINNKLSPINSNTSTYSYN